MILSEIRRKLVPFLILTLIILIVTPVEFYQKDFVTLMAKNALQTMKETTVKPPTFFGKDVSSQLNEIAAGNVLFYYWAQIFGKGMSQFFIILLVILGIGEFASDLNSKTAYFYLNFMDRRKYFLQKTGVSIALLFLSVFAAYIESSILVGIYHYPISLFNLANAFLQLYLSILGMYCLTSTLSLFLRKRSLTPAAVILTLIVFMSLPVLIPGLYQFASAKNIFMNNQISILPVFASVIFIAANLMVNDFIIRKIDL